jgi:hypothetical protein
MKSLNFLFRWKHQQKVSGIPVYSISKQTIILFCCNLRISEALAWAMLDDFDIAAWTIEKKRKRK